MGVSAVDLGVPERMAPDSESVLLGLLGSDFASLGLASRTARLNARIAAGDQASYELRRLRAQVVALFYGLTERGRNRVWAAIGYPGPVTPPPTPERAPQADPRAQPRRGRRRGRGRRLRDRLGRRRSRDRVPPPAGWAVRRRPRAGRLHERVGSAAGGAARRGEDVPERRDRLVRDRPDGRARRWHARRWDVRELARLPPTAGRRP